MQDNFKDKAKNWDKGATRVGGAKLIADSIEKRVVLNTNMDVMDFGVGTGLLGFEIASKVKYVLGVDTSESMLDKLREKNTSDLYIEALNQDIVAQPLQQTFDGVISSMTLHHVQNLELFFQTIYQNVKQGGFIAIADLELEDGTFHSNNEGVFHFGFDENSLCSIVKNAGFKDVKFENINTIKKPQNDYGVFLLSAKK